MRLRQWIDKKKSEFRTFCKRSLYAKMYRKHCTLREKIGAWIWLNYYSTINKKVSKWISSKSCFPLLHLKLLPKRKSGRLVNHGAHLISRRIASSGMQRRVLTWSVCMVSSPKRYRLESSVLFNEEYVVKYWDRSEEFVKQTTFSVFTTTKGRHALAEQACISNTGCKKADIISVTYQ